MTPPFSAMTISDSYGIDGISVTSILCQNRAIPTSYISTPIGNHPFIRRHPQYEEVLYPRDRRDQRAAEEEKQEEESNIDEHEQLIVSAEQPKLRAFHRQRMHDIAHQIEIRDLPQYLLRIAVDQDYRIG